MSKPRTSGSSLTQCVFGLLALTLCSAPLTACKKKATPPPVAELDPADERAEPTPSGPVQKPSPGPVVTRCRELPQAAPFRVGELAASRSRDDEAEDAGPDDEDEVPAPFSVELGPTRADAQGFVLSALRSLKGQSHAFMALIAADAASGRWVDLGPVHGDPDPPLFAAHGADFLVVAPDMDAGGGMLKLGLVRDAHSAPALGWGPEISGVRRDSTFALEVSGERALLAYAAEVAGKIRVFGALLNANDLHQKLTPEPLSAIGPDVDSPRLARREGGFWLAMARALDAPKGKPNKLPSKDGSSELPEGDSLLDIGTRRIEVTQLDAYGKPVSSPLVVTAPGARPMSFDLAGAADGSAYVSFREDDSTPGADAGALQLVRVRPDGGFSKVELSGELSGTGTPSLLVDESDPKRLWLSAAGEHGATSFGLIGERAVLAPDPLIRGAELIAARDGRLLLARSKGTAVDLSVVQCNE